MASKQDKKTNIGVPEPTIRRMPTYLNLVKELDEKGVVYVSAPQISQRLNIDSTQVVKDLSYIQSLGKPRVGYPVAALRECLQCCLGYNRRREAFLAGVGALGTAILQYAGFSDNSMKIVAAFDIDKEKVGKDIAGIPIFHVSRFRDLSNRLHIPIGIITTPPSAAQEVADMMVGWGIRAIWNFAPVALQVPPHVILQNTHIYANLAVILNKLDTAEKQAACPLNKEKETQNIKINL